LYNLNYDMIIQILQQFNYSGEAHANTPPAHSIEKGGRIILHVQKGTVISCLILSKNGQKLHHDAEAQRLILKMGVLEWDLTPYTPSQVMDVTQLSLQTLRRNTFPDSHASPQRRASYQNEVCSWLSLQRSVYYLCDGKHSSEQIAVLLSQSPHTIEQILHHLQKSGAI